VYLRGRRKLEFGAFHSWVGAVAYSAEVAVAVVVPVRLVEAVVGFPFTSFNLKACVNKMHTSTFATFKDEARFFVFYDFHSIFYFDEIMI